VVETDAVERVQEGEATLDLVGLDHPFEDVVYGQRLTLAGKVVGNREDGSQVVRRVTPCIARDQYGGRVDYWDGGAHTLQRGNSR
jgi:hypothetical protein